LEDDYLFLLEDGDYLIITPEVAVEEFLLLQNSGLFTLQNTNYLKKQ